MKKQSKFLERKNQEKENLLNFILEGIKKGAPVWEKTFKGIPGPWNPHTGTLYSGMNYISLIVACNENQWEYPIFFTFKNVSALGGKVLAKSKSTTVHYQQFKQFDDEKGETVVIPIGRSYNVFNIAQTDLDVNVFLPHLRKAMVLDELHAPFDNFAKSDGLTVRFNDLLHSDRCAYSPSRHIVYMNSISQFVDDNAYYSVLYHEATHATSKTLNRVMNTNKQSWEYAFEELIAEIGSAFLMNRLNIESNRQNHLAYIQSWLQHLENNPDYILKAIQHAQKAADLIYPLTKIPPYNESEIRSIPSESISS